MGLQVVEAFRNRPLHEVLREGGVSGCGGAGFPTWAKYTAPQPFLVVNAQESEPGYFIDKYLHQAKAAELHSLLDHLRVNHLSPGGKVVVAAKLKDKPFVEVMEQFAPSFRVLDCTGRNRHNLKEQTEPLLFAYTDDRYPFGMETALLLIVAQQKIPQGERPSQHGFIVSNTETLWNIHNLLLTGAPVTTKLVHVYGATPKHTFREVAVGTPAAVVLEDAGMGVDEIEGRGFVVVDGGPGWFERVDPRTAVVSRRTNSFLVLDPAVVDVTQKDVFDKPNKPGYPRAETQFQTTPTSLSTTTVRVPLVDNPNFKAVRPALATVAVGQKVRRGERIASADPEGVSLDCHASIDGTVIDVSVRGVDIA